jgi:hypothetical protein
MLHVVWWSTHKSHLWVKVGVDPSWEVTESTTAPTASS